MTSLETNTIAIAERLSYFYRLNKIPNIILHGPPCSGKKTLLENFIKLIYNNNRETIRDCVMIINCAFENGIASIRNDLKLFSEMRNGHNIKSIILVNADKLTNDAQSALRRCIEIYNNSTRFFIIVEDKSKLLRPILSRFCSFYVARISAPSLGTALPPNGCVPKTISNAFQELIKTAINSTQNEMECSEMLYNNGISAMDILTYCENLSFDEEPKVRSQFCDSKKIDAISPEILLHFDKIRREIRNEKIVMACYLIAIRQKLNQLCKT